MRCLAYILPLLAGCSLLKLPAPKQSAPKSPAPEASIRVLATDYIAATNATRGPQQWHRTRDTHGEYLIVLPDLRVTHSDPMSPGTFFPDAGGARVDYAADFPAPGRWYVGVLGKPRSTEGNGVHVGLDGVIPPSGRQMQWCGPTDVPAWSTSQRDSGGTPCGQPGTIWLDVPTPGVHTVSLHQREDGFGFYEFMLWR